MFRKLVAIVALCLVLAACSASGSGLGSVSGSGSRSVAGHGDGSGCPSDSSPRELTVFAAASLNAAFPEISRKLFEPRHPGVKVRFSFEGSPSLAEKILAGAPADVFASANKKNMEKVGEAALSPAEFTRNTLRLIVPRGNPAGVSDLASANAAKLVVCAPQVPCGAVTAKVAEQFGLSLSPVSQEQSVTDVRTKVESGEADAGLVYFTDALLAGEKVEVVDVGGIVDIGTAYMLAALSDAPNVHGAKDFVEAVMSPEGQEILARYGFGSSGSVAGK
ncbi:molybdate ABC transporter substrate-binding protein [Trueperella pecoris]|uniref:molybdate ABC transporter substrate-binding protein n=1 Tax=Trueperella pecoris TaxID=2733571 RepID=UPI00186B6E69|nr:molybdate ABC transporter substrate-binding protein [Trueperella pecoris]QOQ39797.1 molybdate ABC transporter substrate-binding protein [Trueperella pecoris]